MTLIATLFQLLANKALIKVDKDMDVLYNIHILNNRSETNEKYINLVCYHIKDSS